MAKVSARVKGSSGRARAPARRALPRAHEVEPALATLVATPPRDAGWIYETKYDGYRILARVQNGQVQLATRNGKDFTARAPKVATALQSLAGDGHLLDGELVSPARSGNVARAAGDFQALQNALREGRSHELVYYVFDCLFVGGTDLRAEPLLARKQALAELLARDGPVLKRSKHLSGSGATLLAHACKLGMEGIIAKRADAPYRSGRGKDWLKLKCSGREEFVVVGFTPPAGARAHLGALLLATREQAKGPLRYAGKVGTGFSVASLRELATRLAPLARRSPPVENPPRGAEAREARWVEPRLVAEVSFTELTADGRLRHPSFHGLRADKAAADVVRESRRRTLPRAARARHPS